MTQNNTKTGKRTGKKLTARQLSAIPAIVSCPTYSEGIKKARIGRKTFYRWLEIPEFKTELDRQRGEIASEAFWDTVAEPDQSGRGSGGLAGHSGPEAKAVGLQGHYRAYPEI